MPALAEERMNLHYLPMPELQFPWEELRDWGRANRQNFSHSRGDSTGGLWGCVIPYHFVKILNDQFLMDIFSFNQGQQVVRNGQMYILLDDYPEHIDLRRAASINILLNGRSRTVFAGDIECPYVLGEPMLFNTQMPHAVYREGVDERMMVSFMITIGFQRMANLYERGVLFRDIPRIYHTQEVIPE